MSISSAKAGEVDAKTWGVLAAASYEDIALSAAYNRNNSHHAALSSLGGGSFYTSMEDQTLDAVAGEQAEALLMAIEYNGVKNTTLGVVYGEFKARNKADYDAEELDVYLTYQWHKAVSTDVVYATVNDKNGLGVDHQFRAIVTVSY